MWSAANPLDRANDINTAYPRSVFMITGGKYDIPTRAQKMEMAYIDANLYDLGRGVTLQDVSMIATTFVPRHVASIIQDYVTSLQNVHLVYVNEVICCEKQVQGYIVGIMDDLNTIESLVID